MKLARLAAVTCAALALVATSFDIDAHGRGGGSRGKAASGGVRHHHHHFAHSRVFIGSSFVFWPRAYYWPDDYYAPPVAAPVIEYWYYCQEAAAYYPYVQECPGGWEPVLPRVPPPEG